MAASKRLQKVSVLFFFAIFQAKQRKRKKIANATICRKNSEKLDFTRNSNRMRE